MNPLRTAITILLLSGLTLAPSPAAQPAAGTPQAQRLSAPLGLLRLKTTAAKPTPALAASRYSIDPLEPGSAPGVERARRNDVDFLALAPGREWSRPLRGHPREVTYVSFQLCVSRGSVVEIAGARLGFTEGSMRGGIQLMHDAPSGGALGWTSLDVQVATSEYAGRPLAALSTLTVRCDPDAGLWDLYLGSRLLATGLPLIADRKSDRRIVIRAGQDGVWLTGLVLSDEHPLYDDANANGIDDTFERSLPGAALLPANATLAQHQDVARQWRLAQLRTPPLPLLAHRPLPDRHRANRSSP